LDRRQWVEKFELGQDLGGDAVALRQAVETDQRRGAHGLGDVGVDAAAEFSFGHVCLIRPSTRAARLKPRASHGRHSERSSLGANWIADGKFYCATAPWSCESDSSPCHGGPGQQQNERQA